MRERPIIFSADSVRSILSGIKTQTRRVVKGQEGYPQYPKRGGIAVNGRPSFYAVSEDSEWPDDPNGRMGGWVDTCPYGVPGDRLWVKEGWAIAQCGGRVSVAPEAWPEGLPTSRLRYLATDEAPHESGRWWNKRSPIFMPRWASRLTLDITGIRVERLQEISEEDARAEGFRRKTGRREETAVGAFADTWNEINGEKYPWYSNPWVWVVEFAAARTEGREGTDATR